MQKCASRSFYQYLGFTLLSAMMAKRTDYLKKKFKNNCAFGNYLVKRLVM